MQLPSKTPAFLALTSNQKIFVSHWYMLTHPHSLDSYRVQMHNGRTIIEELAYQLEIGIAKEDDLLALCQECIQTIEKDPCLPNVLGFQFDRLKKYLGQAVVEISSCLKEKDSKKRKTPDYKPLMFLTQDISASTKDRYLEAVFKLIQEHVNLSDQSFEIISSTTSALVSDLVDRGWQLEALRSWTKSLLNNHLTRPFEHRIHFMLKVLSSPPQSFRIFLRLIGGGSLLKLKTFGGFVFSEEVNEVISHKSKGLERFQKSDQQIAFASSEVEAVDFKAATHIALEKFEYCLDRIRFNFSRNKISVAPEMLLVRPDGKFRLEKISFDVPNPVFQYDAPRFIHYNKRLDDLITSKRVHPETVQRLLATARHYRLGQDAESYRDKFLNWWFGLEFLSKSDRGNIGETTVRRASLLMMERYLFWLLEDLSYSMLDKVASVLNPRQPAKRAKKVTADVLLGLLQDSSLRKQLIAELEDQPLLQCRVEFVAEKVTDAKKLWAFLEAHQKRVSWHLKRLWSIRCSLVHGTPLKSRLVLPVSNVEFYLRECLVVVLRCLDQHPHIRSLDEVYERAEFSWTTVNEALNGDSADCKTIQSVAFDGLAYHPNNFST